jgi:Raf kinase inhibitor-like YbhB/YbcL family protein
MFEIHSPAFAQGEAIPRKYTCEGDDISPSLAWSGAPAETTSFAVLVDDPDAPDPAAPKRVWVHWIRYNIGADVDALAEGAGNAAPQDGARDAVTDARGTGWHGPCPPRGRHRYFFHLYALDTILPDLGARATRHEVERAMEGHVVGEAEWIGTYEKGDG